MANIAALPPPKDVLSSQDHIKTSASIIVENEVSLPFPPARRPDHRFTLKTPITDPNAQSAERYSLQINELTLNGFLSQSSSVANFRNIQYANIPARWHEARAIDPTQEKGVVDATQWGPRCPQPVDVLHDATRHLYPRMATWDRQSEFECLNLNVCAPVSAIEPGGRGGLLPVLVWIHGGAFVFGDGGCESDGQWLVKRSIDKKDPIVVVGFNYRLGVLGFLTSRELREEARERGDVGFANLGLHDQRIALQWIQQNIHFFGGDGSRLTVAGESAGAISILAHLRGKSSVFQNAFMMSPALMDPLPLEDAQQTFDKLVAATGLSEAPVGQKLSALRSMSPSEVHEVINSGVSPLIEDPEFFEDYSGERHEEVSNIPSWIRRIVVGQTKDETALFAERYYHLPVSKLYDEWKEIYADSSYAEEVFAAYNVTLQMSQADFAAAFIDCSGDVMFGKVVHSIATTHLDKKRSSSQKTFLYSFDQPDMRTPKSTFRNRAYHSLDNGFLFAFPQTLGPEAPAEFRATAEQYSDAVLRLTTGNDPWDDVSVEGRFMSFQGGAGAGLKDSNEWYSRRWSHLTNTEERLRKFGMIRELMLESMAYGMSLPMNESGP